MTPPNTFMDTTDPVTINTYLHIHIPLYIRTHDKSYKYRRVLYISKPFPIPGKSQINLFKFVVVVVDGSSRRRLSSMHLIYKYVFYSRGGEKHLTQGFLLKCMRVTWVGRSLLGIPTCFHGRKALPPFNFTE